MKLALFYEIPVARPWSRHSEHEAYKNVVEQAVLGEQAGFHSLWTVEHHFLEEFSHCSNPEILYGHIAAKTSKLRLGYGVRLLPRPYNHPGAHRRVGRSARPALRRARRVRHRPLRDARRARGLRDRPGHTRAMWQEALEHIVGCWTNDEYSFHGTYWSMPRRRVLPKPLQDPHPPIWGATTSLEGHRQIGRLGIGLCSFSVGLPPESFKEKVAEYRKGISECPKPIGKFMNNQAATFTMVHCADTNERAFADAAESMVWYPKVGAKQIASLADWMKGRDLGNYAYAGDIAQSRDAGTLDQMNFDYIRDSGAAMVGDPRAASRSASAMRRRAATCCSASSTRTRSRTRR
jgi:alkanesulfonate monooxygenase SsuD/methylene tetrahydromethanopterin reductase-like flavin-dependent oxidoreductase (luciferase family)